MILPASGEAVRAVREPAERQPPTAPLRGSILQVLGVLKAATVKQGVDGYAPVIAGLQHDIDEIETEVFGGDPKVSRCIYELSREVIEFQRATRPLLEIMRSLEAGFQKCGIDEELQRYLRDVADHATYAAERVDGFRQMLQNILTVNAALVSQAQNEEMKQLAEAGHAQNDEIKKMPELHWVFGYPFAIALMGVVCVGLYLIFKRRNWL